VFFPITIMMPSCALMMAYLIKRAHDGDQDHAQAQQAELDTGTHAGSQQHAMLWRPEHVTMHQLPPSFLIEVPLKALQVTVLLGIPGTTTGTAAAAAVQHQQQNSSTPAATLLPEHKLKARQLKHSPAQPSLAHWNVQRCDI
jgi:hypothetical protein